MRAARLVIDVKNEVVWSRRPKSATKGPIGPNPEFPVSSNSVHSSVAMTEPQHAHRVVVPRFTASSPEELDIKTCPTCMHPSGNSSSSSQAITQAPSAHGGRSIPTLRDHTQRSSAEQTINSAAGDPGQVKHTRKRRRQVSDDPPTDSAVEPRAPLTPPRELFESVTATDVDHYPLF